MRTLIAGSREGVTYEDVVDAIKCCPWKVTVVISGAEGLDVAGALQEKFEYNQTREDHKIENRKKSGG